MALFMGHVRSILDNIGQQQSIRENGFYIFLGAGFITVSRILHHIHPCLIYEAIMRQIRKIYEAIMRQITLIFSKNEVLGPAFLFTTKPL